MGTPPIRARKVQAKSIPGLVRELTLVDVKIPDVRDRLGRAPKLTTPGDPSACCLNWSCCIIDCSKCTPEDMSIYEDPATLLEQFVFKQHGQEKNPDAPVFYVPEGSARAAFAVGHQSMQIPGPHASGKVIGLAGEIFGADVLRGQHISPTAPVIAISPAAAH